MASSLMTYAEYQTGVGERSNGPAGSKATIISNHSPTTKARLTGEEELGDKRSGGSLHNVVRLEQTVRDGLLDTHPSSLLVVQRSQGEWESSSLLLDLGEHGSRCLHLELVVDVGLLVDRGPRLVRLGLGVSFIACIARL
jgi:hypothetical protein